MMKSCVPRNAILAVEVTFDLLNDPDQLQAGCTVEEDPDGNKTLRVVDEDDDGNINSFVVLIGAVLCQDQFDNLFAMSGLDFHQQYTFAP